MLTKKRRNEINEYVAKIGAVSSALGYSYEFVIIQELINHVKELESTVEAQAAQLSGDAPTVCERCYSKLKIKGGRLVCPKGHEVNHAG